MSTSRRILKNLASLTIAEIANKGLVFVSTVYLARVLLPDGFGLYSWVNTFTMYFVFFTNLGFDIVGTREIAKNKADVPKYVNNIVSARILISIFVTILYTGIVLNLDQPLYVKSVFLISGVNMFSNAILLDWVYKGIERMGILALRQVITSSSNLIGIIIFVHTPEHVHLAVAIIAVSTFLNSVWMYLLYKKLYTTFKFQFDKQLIKYLGKASVPIAFFAILSTLMNSLNINLIGFFDLVDDSERTIGLYSAANRLLSLGVIPATIIQSAFLPLLSRSETKEERAKVLEKFLTLLFFAGAIIASGIYTYAEFFVETAFEADYSESIPALRILMFTCGMAYLSVAGCIPLIAWKKERTAMYIIAVAVGINLVMNLILIPKYNVEGAALATIFSEASVAIVASIVVGRIVGKAYSLRLFIFVAMAVVSCYLGYLLHQQGLHEVISGGISLIIYIALNLTFKTITLSEIRGYLKK
jgi:O-antigen/teichoic acid export membrane protein